MIGPLGPASTLGPGGRRTQTVMGMPITIDLRDQATSDPALDEAFAELIRVDELFSPFLPDSAVSQMNAGLLDARDAGGLVAEVIRLCRHYAALTDGYFAAWSADRFDPSGLVKGWAMARACAVLDAHGARNYFLDAAGDVRTRGHNGRGAPWRVGIRHPVQREKVARVVLAHDLAVATSGTYEKGRHIYNPHSGLPATSWISFTVVGPDIVAADVYATAAFAMGPRGLDFIEGLSDYEGYAIDPALHAHWSAGFDDRCEEAEGGSPPTA